MFFQLILFTKVFLYNFGCLKNDHMLQHNGFIAVDKKYLGIFLSNKMRL